MSKPFDLKKQLKLHDARLLRRLFDERGAVPDTPWDQPGSHESEPIAGRWNAVPRETRRRVEVVLQDVHELSDDRGQRILVEDLRLRHPDKIDAFRNWGSLSDKALWAYLEVREVFEEAAAFARAEAMRSGQFANRWNSLPKRPIVVTDEIAARLQDAVRSFYREKELRGDQCRVHHFARAGGADYFYAYLPEWADKRLGFDAAGELTPRELDYAFSNIFIYEADDGALEIIAKGGRKVQLPLRHAFCKAVLGLDVDDADPIRRTYHLDHLLDPDFAFVTDAEDGVAVVRLRRVRLEPRVAVPALERGELDFREEATLPEIREAAARWPTRSVSRRRRSELFAPRSRWSSTATGAAKPAR